MNSASRTGRPFIDRRSTAEYCRRLMAGGATEEPRSDEENVAGESAQTASDESAETTTDEAPPPKAAEPSAKTEKAPAPPSQRSFSFGEFFLLRAWRRDTEIVGSANRGQVIDQAALSQQQRSAAEALWAAEHPADALDLARRAYRTALRAYEWLPASAVASSHRVSSASRLETAVLDDARKNDGRDLPVLDAAVRAIDEQCYQTWLDAQGILLARCEYFSADRPKIRVVQTGRIATAVFLSLALAFGLWWTNRSVVTVTESGHWNDLPQFAPENALDGNRETEWVLPDASHGWLNIELRPARAISTIRVTNGTNGPYRDRGTHAFRVELYRGGEHLRDLNGTFDEIDPDAEPVTLDAGGERVDRVRFVVVSHHSLGAALAELSLE
jgi:hypothetical protein